MERYVETAESARPARFDPPAARLSRRAGALFAGWMRKLPVVGRA
jgi:hypothetical protein